MKHVFKLLGLALALSALVLSGCKKKPVRDESTLPATGPGNTIDPNAVAFAEDPNTQLTKRTGGTPDSENKSVVDAIYFGPGVAALLRTVVANNSPASGVDTLTDREREILKLVAESNSTKEIAAKLAISVKTVDNHRTNLMRKLNLHDVASLTRYALEIGLIEHKKSL